MSEQLTLELVKIDSPLTGKVKGDALTARYNFFSLARGGEETELQPYDDGRVRIEVAANKHGVATMWDKEILIYVASLVVEKLNRSGVVENRITFTSHDFLRVSGGIVGGSAYNRIRDSLRRLKGTTISTNLETGGQGTDGGFGWISDYKIHYRRTPSGERVMRAVEVSVCDWLFRALVADQSILTYNSRYFELTPLEKRLYEIARSGPREGFRIGLGKLYLRVGCRMDLKHFKAEITKFAGHKKSVPDYAISIVNPRLRHSLDRTAPPPPRRTPLKSLMVAFFPTTGLRSLAPIDSLPLVQDEAPPRAPIMQ